MNTEDQERFAGWSMPSTQFNQGDSITWQHLHPEDGCGFQRWAHSFFLSKYTQCGEHEKTTVEEDYPEAYQSDLMMNMELRKKQSVWCTLIVFTKMIFLFVSSVTAMSSVRLQPTGCFPGQKCVQLWQLCAVQAWGDWLRYWKTPRCSTTVTYQTSLRAQVC